MALPYPGGLDSYHSAHPSSFRMPSDCPTSRSSHGPTGVGRTTIGQDGPPPSHVTGSRLTVSPEENQRTRFTYSSLTVLSLTSGRIDVEGAAVKVWRIVNTWSPFVASRPVPPLFMEQGEDLNVARGSMVERLYATDVRANSGNRL